MINNQHMISTPLTTINHHKPSGLPLNHPTMTHHAFTSTPGAPVKGGHRSPPRLVAQVSRAADAGTVDAAEGRVANEFAVTVHPDRARLGEGFMMVIMVKDG